MKKTVIYFYLAVLLITFNACETISTDAINPIDKPVVEAFLRPNAPVRLKVFTIKPFENATDSSKGINGLKITITGSDGRVFYLKNEKNGFYYSSPTELIGGVGSVYQLQFSFKNQLIIASAKIPEKPLNFKSNKQEISIKQVEVVESNGVIGITSSSGGNSSNATNKITLTWSNPNSDYHFISYFNTNPNPESILKTPPGFPIIEIPSFTLPPDQSSITFLHAENFKSYGTHGIVLYRLNSDYATLFETMNSSTQNIRTPNSMITNGLGIFTGINTDTVFIQIKKKI